MVAAYSIVGYGTTDKEKEEKEPRALRPVFETKVDFIASLMPCEDMEGHHSYLLHHQLRSFTNQTLQGPNKCV